MKKMVSILCVILVITLCYAGRVRKNWSPPTTMGNGTTVIASGSTGKRIVLKNIMFTVANACYIYFFSDGTTDTAISNKFYLAAKSGISSLDWDNVDILTKSGEGLSVWASADTGGNMIYEVGNILTSGEY